MKNVKHMRAIRFVFILFASFIIHAAIECTPASAEVIFSDHFDDQPYWNSSQSSDLISLWTGTMCRNRGGDYEACYIQDHADPLDGSVDPLDLDRGKFFTQYWDSTTTHSWAQDLWIYKNNINFPNEWYWGYWFRIDPDWDWGGANRLKIAKLQHNDGETQDIYWAKGGCLCGPDDWESPPSGCVGHICTDSMSGRNSFACWVDIADGNWHYFIWHFNYSEGVLELEVDGISVRNTSNPSVWPGTNYSSSYGLNFGGNISNGGGAVNEMWTKYDDVIIATTRQDVEDFLGVSYSDDLDDDLDVDGEDLALLAMQVDSGTAGEPEISSFACSFSARR